MRKICLMKKKTKLEAVTETEATGSDEEAQVVDKAATDNVTELTALEGGGGVSGEDGDGQENLNLVLDIPLKVTVELGRTRVLVSDLLNLGQGSVIEMNKLAGEPMEVMVNDKTVAYGEAVVINEKFGVRLTEVISIEERAMKLG